MPVSPVVDVVVVGDDLAGVAAALALRSFGRSVMLAGHLCDSSRVEDSHQLLVPGLAPTPVSGVALARLARSALAAVGVRQDIPCPDRVHMRDGFVEVVDLAQHISVTARAAVFAPSGSSPDLGAEWEPLLSRSVSCSARTDSMYFADQRVALVGSGPRLASEAKWVAVHARECFVLVEEAPSIADLAPFREIYVGAEGVRPLVEGGRLTGVQFRAGGRLHSRPAGAVIFAREPIVRWDVWDGVGVARPFVAGLAAGVSPHEPLAQWASGETAARACHRSLES